MALGGKLVFDHSDLGWGLIAFSIIFLSFPLLDDLSQALVLQQKGNPLELVDPKLGTKFDKEEAMRIIKVALLCTNPSPAHRPTMSEVVSMLKGRTNVHEIISEPSSYGDGMRFKSLTEFNQVIL
ncbi:hypothetical protein J1N35_033989 [Gossypium stocksii]|uniref:Serine-threonine/tyrosine-protein kinase catalytic domain-containing protein n=1 Tax=Gossypium stocksii TaxID=47602 RepID=A0A9D3UT37_9ROSI|nr:hypothetical protein J1N35_033989 [Gossypium stocksii]